MHSIYEEAKFHAKDHHPMMLTGRFRQKRVIFYTTDMRKSFFTNNLRLHYSKITLATILRKFKIRVDTCMKNMTGSIEI